MSYRGEDLYQLKYSEFDASQFRSSSSFLPRTPPNLTDFNANYSSTPTLSVGQAAALQPFAEYPHNNYQICLPPLNNHQQAQPLSASTFQHPFPCNGDPSLAAATCYYQYMRYKNNQVTSVNNSVLTPTLRHILTRLEPLGVNRNSPTLAEERELIPNRPSVVSGDNQRQPSAARKQAAGSKFMNIAQTIIIKKEAEEVESGDRLKPVIVDFNMMGRKRKHSSVASKVSTFSSTEPSGSRKGHEMKVNMNSKQKRKRANNQSDNGAMRDDTKKTNNLHLLSRVHQSKSWIKTGVVVKSIQHDKPMGTIIEVSEDKTTCLLQFFNGWRAEILTKFITQFQEAITKHDAKLSSFAILL